MTDKIIIIAEAGVNHNGDINLAFKLVDEAYKCGADYIKFQTFKTELIVDKNAPKAHYQNKNVGHEISQFDMIKNLELSYNDFHEIKNYCDKIGIKFLTSTGELETLKFLDEYNLDYMKVPSGELNNYLFLKSIGEKGKPVLLSTGMGNLGEIEQAIEILTKNGTERNLITILHCNTEYPTPFADANLYAINTLKNAFKTKVGYSDHTIGIEASIAAVGLGACVIEKHFTLDKTMIGPDHMASLNPEEFSNLVKAIRNVEKAISGTGIKWPSKSEQQNINIVRKSIFINKDINFGEEFNEDNLIVKRPGNGIPADMIKNIIGRKANMNLKAGSILNFNEIIW